MSHIHPRLAVLVPCCNEGLTISTVVKEFRPFLFFGMIFVLLGLISMLLGIPVLRTYVSTGLVPRFPTAILAASIMLLAFLSLTCGLILDSVSRGRREVKRMAYLSYPSSVTFGKSDH